MLELTVFPEYSWKLSTQFDETQKIYKKLSKKFDLQRTDYFQTGLMYFDTKIITESTYNELISLVKKYPITTTNEQGILNLFFFLLIINMKNLNHVDGKLTYFYWKLNNEEVIITKSLKKQYK